jgi:PhzF family phenazine biosynthesis protein
MTDNMQIPVYQVDAFAEGPFSGNPAAVCPLSDWLEEDLMQKIAAENNLSETAFYIPLGSDFHIRWFTPTVEVDLCGHATLAAAFVIFRSLPAETHSIRLFSRSGWLTVSRDEQNGLTLDFPADPVEQMNILPEGLSAGLNKPIMEVMKGRFDLLVRVQDASSVIGLKPDLRLLAGIPVRGIIVTAPGDDCDFVSRFFGPACGVDEDPVTGSAHCTLTNYWSSRTGKSTFTARQCSQRGGFLRCTLSGDRVLISGKCHLFMAGHIFI